MKHNEIPNADRAEIVAILVRLISELAGGSPTHDRDVDSVMLATRELCYRSGRIADWHNAINLVTDKDWVFTVRKTADNFELEANFGRQTQTAVLD